MMSKTHFATDNEIKHASEILLPKGYCFLNDAEKTEIIKCNDSKDIVACPGSGKTTTLLAKLLILANRMPLEKNKGICVLTHTNVAIDEIKDKLGSKAGVLFRYPNHFGTIQSFVDKFLTAPYFINKYGYKLTSIDNERYRIQFDKNQYKYMGRKAIAFCHRMQSKGYPYSICCSDFEVSDRQCTQLGLNLTIKDQKAIYDGLLRTKKYSIESGYLNYKDAYSLAKLFLENDEIKENLVESFASRFRYVFIDEMQDTARHQIELLDKVFDFKKINVQRFGDPYQSIYNKVSLEKIWEPKNFLPITTSCRFGDTIASVLRTVCIEDNSDLKASGEIQSQHPIIIVYENPNEVLPKFCELLLKRNIDFHGEQLSVFDVSKREKRPIKAVGWVGNELDEKYPERFKLKSYFEDYHKEVKKKDIVDYTSLKSFFRKIEGAKVKDYKNKIIEAMLHILRIEGKTYEKNGRKYFYTKTSFLSILEEANLLIKFNKSCSIWISKLNETDSINENTVKQVKKHFIKNLFPLFNINSKNQEVVNFLNNEINEDAFNEKTIESRNIYTYPEDARVKVEVSNIHQVKGETHTATLYMETWYQGNFESESIAPQMLGAPYEQPKKKKDTYTKETLKMAYVGMSRPRYLLCMAVHKDRYDEDLDIENGGLWEIVKTNND